MAAYERVIDLVAGHPEATSALVDYFTEQARCGTTSSRSTRSSSAAAAYARAQETGVILQIAMVHWRMRGQPDAAEPYFERLRKTEPAHAGHARLLPRVVRREGRARRASCTILTDAQRAMPDGPERARSSTEIAKLAEEAANATKAIEQWRDLSRQDPSNSEARDALKRLYRADRRAGTRSPICSGRSSSASAPDDAAARLPILREIAGVYREHVKSDSALVTVLSQIIALDPTDIDAVRELARVYEALGRWRDLLTTQTRLAELETERGEKAELYRAVARRWLDQFSNVQNAVEAYEKLLEVEPERRRGASRS